ncbi:MAG: acetoacetate decarboxylase family protein [Pararhodobacter sp.]|nr:acetoacetate decarboxylase family protein [Pararhodobacter sp.]
MAFGFQDAGLPWGEARPYPPFPHPYRGAEDLVVGFTAPAQAVRPFLPRGVEPAGDPVVCQAKFRWVPLSVHGPYHEAYVSATVRFEGQEYRFLLLAYTDNESPLIAGREIWGTPKKLARMKHGWRSADGLFSDHLVATLERPRGMRLMTLGLVMDRQTEPPTTPPLPTLLLKILPDAANERPALAQLIRLEGHATPHRAADGSAMIFTGRPSLSFDAMSTADPLHLLRPTALTGGSFARLDFSHGPGVVIHDYLAEG